MRRLPSQELLRLWEEGRTQHPLDRALTLLQAAEGGTRRALAQLPMGERDARLLSLHEQLFGSELRCYAECPHCAERLEFSVSTSGLRVPTAQPGERELSEGGYTLRFRPLDSTDLAAATQCSGEDAAVALLVRRCVLSATLKGEPVEPDALPDQVVQTLSSALLECDPQAELLLDLKCPGCGRSWQSPLELVPFLWTQITSRARRLLREVHTLAMAYGWSEEAILSLGDARRQAYLSLVNE